MGIARSKLRPYPDFGDKLLVDTDLARSTPSGSSVPTYNEIQVGRYVRFLQKFLGTKAREPDAVTVAPEIAPVLPLFHGAENRYLEGWDRFGVQARVAAGVGLVDGFRLRNPQGSNVIAVVEAASVVFSAVADLANLSIGTTSVDRATTSVGNSYENGGVVVVNLPARGRPNSSCIASFDQTGAVGVVVQRKGAASGTSIDFILTDTQELQLLPGRTIDIFGQTANIQTDFTITWRERFLEDAERS